MIKKILRLLMIFMVTIQLFPVSLLAKSSNQSTYYEAEKAELLTNRENKKDSNASGGEAVFLPYGKINNVDAYCKFTFHISQAGFYNLSINSWGIGAEKKNYLDLDGIRLENTYLRSPKEEWKEHNFLKNYYLEKGGHSVTVTAGYGYTYLDYLKVEQTSALPTEEIYNKNYGLSNRNATTKTKEKLKPFH